MSYDRYRVQAPFDIVSAGEPGSLVGDVFVVVQEAECPGMHFARGPALALRRRH
jgi:hypothetical protein